MMKKAAVHAAAVAPFFAFAPVKRRKQKRNGSLHEHGRQKGPRMISLAIPISAELAERLDATGKGWQLRAKRELHVWLRRNRATAAKGTKTLLPRAR